MNFHEEVAASSRPLVVFGASIIGKIILDSLDLLDIQPICFCDNDAQKQRELFHGYEVLSFERLLSSHPDALIVIAAGRYFKEIKYQLTNVGFNDIYSDADVINCIDFKKTPPSKLEKIVWHLAGLGKLSEIKDLPPGNLHIPRLNIVITSRCTLRCEHCSSLMPYYKKPSDFDTSGILDSIDRMFACVDLIYHVEVLGGEVFLNENLPLIVRHLLNLGKILHMDVITNGTVLPPDSVLESLKHDSVSVVIDDYGRLSKKKAVLSDALKRLGSDFRINKHWAWADLGGLQSRNRSEKQLAGLFSICNFNSCAELLDGRLYRCPRSSHGTKTERIPEYPGDFLDMADSSVGTHTLKEALRAFFYDKDFIHACDHCNGNTDDSLMLTPAEQKDMANING